jgi:acyl-CoA thioesterase FadM
VTATGEPGGAASGAAAWTAPYRVRFDEAGPDGALRTAGFLRFAQDVAWLHSDARGFTRAWYAQRGLAWLVRAASLEVLEPAPMGTTLAVTTQVVEFGRIWAGRRAECRLPDGRLAAVVRTDWVMVDERGRLARVPGELLEQFPVERSGGSVMRVELRATPPDAARMAFRVRPHELDPMNHPNNAVYLDWLEESMLAAGPEASRATSRHPRSVRLEYAAAASPASVVESAVWEVGDGWRYRVADVGGRDLLRAELR